MKKVKNTLFGLMAVIALLTSTNLNAGCDTTPNVGQTVGICKATHDPDYSWYSCNIYNEGEDQCYFNAPPVQE